ncbi:MAG: DUF4388 domain-containing protein [Myxococcota bacterium]|jgi:hypothetical protein
MKKFALDVDINGRMVLDEQALRSLGLASASKPVAMLLDEGCALFVDDEAQDRPPVLFGSMNVMEPGVVVETINENRKSGVLLFHNSEADKSLFFKKGEVVYATSTLKEDRLGNTLWRSGMLSLETLNQVSDMVGKGGKRLGELLIEIGKLQPRDLYVGLTLQVKEIFFSAFQMSDGWFVFVERDLTERNEVKLHEFTADLMMQALTMSGELSRLRAFVPEMNARFAAKESSSGPNLDKKEAAVLALARSGETFDKIMSASGLGEFSCYKVIEKLIRIGLLTPVVEKQHGIIGYEDRVAKRLEALKLCYNVLKAKGPKGAMNLVSYLENPPACEELLGGLVFDEDGMIEKALLIDRSVRIYGAEAGEKLTEALDELTQYAMFEVKNVIAPADAQAVTRAVLGLYAD